MDTITVEGTEYAGFLLEGKNLHTGCTRAVVFDYNGQVCAIVDVIDQIDDEIYDADSNAPTTEKTDFLA